LIRTGVAFIEDSEREISEREIRMENLEKENNDSTPGRLFIAEKYAQEVLEKQLEVCV
jgi:hypothetical protein